MPNLISNRRYLDKLSHPLSLAAISLGLIAGIATALPGDQENKTIERVDMVQTLNLDDLTVLTFDNESFFSEAVIERGDTIQLVLQRLGINEVEAVKYLSNAPEVAPLRASFIAGRRLSANSNNSGQLLQLYFPITNQESALVVARTGTGFTAEVVAERPETHTITKAATITSSLFNATDLAGIPDSIAIQLAEIFSSEIDFHRDLRQGDQLVVSYESLNLRGQPSRTGKILAAEFTNNGRTHHAIWFDRPGQQGEYLSQDGKPLKKSFLRSPLEFSRVSSGFSTRFHPILNTWRAHQGIDYAAPVGTPIRATGNASVEFIGQQRGYGNTVILKHDEQYTTLYAHLSRFPAGLRKGSKVSQGQTIGYVGQTGWATGPHLHYEFRIKGKPVDPLAIKLPIMASTLSRNELKQFNNISEQKLALLDQIRHLPLVRME